MANDTSYVIHAQFASPTASSTSPHLQILAGASPFYVLRIEIDQETSTTSAVMAVEFVRSTLTAAGTLTSTGVVTTALNARDPASRVIVTNAGFSGVGTGTQTVLERHGFNVLSGYQSPPTPQEYFEFDQATALWIRFPLVAAVTLNVTVRIDEI